MNKTGYVCGPLFGIFIAILTFVNIATCKPPEISPFLQNTYLAGFDLSINNRKGYVYYGDRFGYKAVQRENLLLSGISAGKRFGISDFLRFQLGGIVSLGSSVEDTTGAQALDDGTIRILTKNNLYIHLGILPEFQVPLPVSPDASVFFRAGGGGHFMNIQEQEYVLGSPDFRVLDPYLENHSVLSLSVHGGAGFEFEIGNRIGFALTYIFRYWRPVKYGITSDLFPYSSVPYKERFLTHSFDLSVLLKRD